MATAISWGVFLGHVAAAVDAARFSSAAWRTACRDKAFWMVMLFFFGVLFIVPYLIFVRPRLRAARMTGAMPAPAPMARVGPETRPPMSQPATTPLSAERNTTVSSAVIVQNRSTTRRIDALNMDCNEQEIPAFLRRQPKRYWIAGTAGFASDNASNLAPDGSLEPGYEIRVMGTMALGIADGRLIAIVSPNEATAPAVWINAALADLTVTAEGKTGVFKRRPAVIEINGPDGWELTLGHVRKLDRSDNTISGGSEDSLVAALAA